MPYRRAMPCWRMPWSGSPLYVFSFNPLSPILLPPPPCRLWYTSSSFSRGIMAVILVWQVQKILSADLVWYTSSSFSGGTMAIIWVWQVQKIETKETSVQTSVQILFSWVDRKTKLGEVTHWLVWVAHLELCLATTLTQKESFSASRYSCSIIYVRFQFWRVSYSPWSLPYGMRMPGVISNESTF